MEKHVGMPTWMLVGIHTCMRARKWAKCTLGMHCDNHMDACGDAHMDACGIPTWMRARMRVGIHTWMRARKCAKCALGMRTRLARMRARNAR